MNATEKKKFIRELIGNLRERILENVPRMPEEWDGIELRQYVADRFMNSTILTPAELRVRPHLRKRARDYRNEVLVRNL